ncbi:MAG TPA: SOS response-associated peptidase [Tepidisphaeraceae bacterium]|jgi:putative SOS response-associated peptidase YedK
MCGRFTLITLAQIPDVFPWIHLGEVDARPRYNIAPSQPILAVANDGRNTLDYMQWGLVPSWAKDPSIGSKMINARAETLAQKPAFRQALARRRCLIPADGFYEWKKRGKTKIPMLIRMKSHRPFMFAGLWEVWRDANGNKLPTCTVITTAPNELMKEIHDRMPAVLRPEVYEKWLSTEEKVPAELQSLLEPFPADAMEAIPVSTAVNSPRNDSPECIEAIETNDMQEEQGSLF